MTDNGRRIIIITIITNQLISSSFGCSLEPVLFHELTHKAPCTPPSCTPLWWNSLFRTLLLPSLTPHQHLHFPHKPYLQPAKSERAFVSFTSVSLWVNDKCLFVSPGCGAVFKLFCHTSTDVSCFLSFPWMLVSYIGSRESPLWS